MTPEQNADKRISSLEARVNILEKMLETRKDPPTPAMQPSKQASSSATK
jgi:hypothetical protein